MDGTIYHDKHMKWLLKPLEKILSSCCTQPVTVCSILAHAASFLIYPPVEPNKWEKQKNNMCLSWYIVPSILEGLYLVEVRTSPKVPREPHALSGMVYSVPHVSKIIAVILDITIVTLSKRALSQAVIVRW
jgi:hypothetical protein